MLIPDTVLVRARQLELRRTLKAFCHWTVRKPQAQGLRWMDGEAALAGASQSCPWICSVEWLMPSSWHTLVAASSTA